MYTQESRLEPPEDRVFGHCDHCGDEIYENELYYDVNGKKIHYECLRDYAAKQFASCLKEAACNVA